MLRSSSSARCGANPTPTPTPTPTPDPTPNPNPTPNPTPNSDANQVQSSTKAQWARTAPQTLPPQAPQARERPVAARSNCIARIGGSREAGVGCISGMAV
eukprot:scaffold93019_cov53-Phaeocystis_antarctica.AAC.1